MEVDLINISTSFNKTKMLNLAISKMTDASQDIRSQDIFLISTFI